MNYFMIVSVLLASSSVALGASLRPYAVQGSGLEQFQELSAPASDAVALKRDARQLNLASSLASALGNGAGLVPGLGSLLSGPVTSLLQAPLSGAFNLLSGGLVNRLGPNSELPQFWSPGFGSPQQFQPWGPSQQYQPWGPSQEPLVYMLN